jgi:hypothetical protein
MMLKAPYPAPPTITANTPPMTAVLTPLPMKWAPSPFPEAMGGLLLNAFKKNSAREHYAVEVAYGTGVLRLLELRRSGPWPT